jgi:DMSO/TMAO reductase YedYZ molybdopterin-dependent catalytic subunit
MRESHSAVTPAHDSSDSKQILYTSGAVREIERRLFLKQGLSLGALTLLTGCDVTDTSAVQSVLDGISRWNDRTQAAIFNPRRLMPTYPESQAVKNFRYNAYFGQSQVPKIDGASYGLILSGLIDRRTPWTLQELYQLPQESQVTRHVCVEGWSMIGKWTGVPFRTFLQRIGADLTAKYVGFECADGYYSSIDMASALHPQTFLTFKISDEILAPRYGYPVKLRIPTKLGFKNPKWITAIFVTNRFPGGFWEDRGYNWFAGV